MKPGRKLDAEVAKEVMGRIPHLVYRPKGDDPQYLEKTWVTGPLSRPLEQKLLLHYSTSISAAWKVADHMHDLGWDFRLYKMTEGTMVSFQWYAPSSGMPEHAIGVAVDPREGDDAYAICKAALKAVRETRP